MDRVTVPLYEPASAVTAEYQITCYRTESVRKRGQFSALISL